MPKVLDLSDLPESLRESVAPDVTAVGDLLDTCRNHIDSILEYVNKHNKMREEMLDKLLDSFHQAGRELCERCGTDVPSEEMVTLYLEANSPDPKLASVVMHCNADHVCRSCKDEIFAESKEGAFRVREINDEEMSVLEDRLTRPVHDRANFEMKYGIPPKIVTISGNSRLCIVNGDNTVHLRLPNI